MPSLHHPTLVASPSRAYRMVPGAGESAGRHDVRSVYALTSESLPRELREAVEKWSGPCAYWGRYCDDGAFAKPLTEAPPAEDFIGLDFPAEEYALCAARVVLWDAARQDRQRREDEWVAAARAWYLAERGWLLREAPAGLRRTVSDHGQVGVVGWLESQAAASEPGRLRVALALEVEGWPYLNDVVVAERSHPWMGIVCVTMPNDFWTAYCHRPGARGV